MKKLSDYDVEPIFAIPPVSEPCVSPDGAKVLFTYKTVNMELNKYESHIWQLKPTVGEAKQFTFSKFNETSPIWSPDGRGIAFISDRKTEEGKAQKMQLWVIPADGGESRCLTTVAGGVISAKWAPNSDKIFFGSNVFKGERLEGSDVKIIRQINYKWDGRGVFDGERTHIFSVSLRNGELKQLTDGDFDIERIIVSPDGKHLAFISNLNDDEDNYETLYFRNIYILDTAGGEPQCVCDGRKWDLDLRWASLGWSPDGKYISFSGRKMGDLTRDIMKNFNIWIMESDGSEPLNLTEKYDITAASFVNEELRWSKESKHIYFRTPENGSMHVYRVSIDGKLEKVIDGKVTVESFSVDGQDEVMALAVSDAVTPPEIWIKDKDGFRRVTNMNKGMLVKLRVSEPEEFHLTTSEGVKVQCWVIKPRDFREGEKYPTILEIHGGPHGMFGYELSGLEHEFQVLANNGYAVIYSNPRASVGQGEAFAAAVYGCWGEYDGRDLMEVVDYAIKTYPFIDPERLGVTGLSYGGYMTNWLIGHSDRFKAAVSRNSLTNMYSGWGTSDIGWLGFQISRAKNPWDNLQFFMEQSPIHYIEKIETPLLLIHCEDDIRCPIEQSEQLFTGLKKLKRKVEFVRFPGESHVMINIGTPKHRVERLQHVVRWFDRYLK